MNNTDIGETTKRIPTDQVAHDPLPVRQVRTGGQNGVSMVEVKQLLDQESPETWGEITVRPWPEDERDLRPPDGLQYQVLIGNHRYVASRSPDENQRDFGKTVGLNLHNIAITVIKPRLVSRPTRL